VIFDASLFTGIKISKNAKDLVVLKSFMTQEELIFNIGNAFYDIVYSQSLHENNLTTLTIMDSIYRKTEMQVKQHITREIDLNRMRINISNLKVEKEKTEAIMAQQKNYLRILMGMPLETIFELADDEIFVLPENNYLADSNNIESKTELQILYNEKTGGLLEIKQLKMSYLPSLSLMASSGYTFQANELDIKNHNNWSNGTYLKLNFSIPIFDGFTKHRKIRQAQIRVNKTEEDIRQIKQNTLSDLQNAQMQLYVNSRAVKAQQENMELAGRTYRQSIMLYEEGLYGITDLLDTEKSFREAQTACDYEMVNYRKALLDLKKAEGTLQSLINKLQNK
jgi:outer membrane protein TolC